MVKKYPHPDWTEIFIPDPTRPDLKIFSKMRPNFGLVSVRENSGFRVAPQVCILGCCQIELSYSNCPPTIKIQFYELTPPTCATLF